MLPQEIIRQKRDGDALTAAEITEFVAGIANGSLAEAQVAAFAMAVYLNGMSMMETVALTRAMTDSGRRIDWADAGLDGPVLDKHSTGGVGDKVSLMLAPLIAACGGYVPMISGRGLGHTGGTLDKLESIPGYDASPDLETFARVVAEVGCAIIGQTDDLAPADRRLYAVRDVTATVESIPLITASILSKKLAAGLDALVMDVKTGSGAFAASETMARELASSIVEVARGAGLATRALITDMDQALGTTAGNALEVAETVAYLTDGPRDARLDAVVMALGAALLTLGGLAADEVEAEARLTAARESGRAADCFAAMARALGACVDPIQDRGRCLPVAPVQRPAPALRSGIVTSMDARALGLAVVELGGGRKRPNDSVDPSVGLSEVAAIGAVVQAGDPLAIVHARDAADAEAAAASLQAAVEIGATAPPDRPVVIAQLGGV
ncbi:MAG: thymidine phosphorylase [Alphaproteobacteria bacterium]|nr:thymidine phosphorylase [Alphaproteobacteria bacterium]